MIWKKIVLYSLSFSLKCLYGQQGFGIHLFGFKDIFTCYRDNENLKQPFGRMDTLKFL